MSIERDYFDYQVKKLYSQAIQMVSGSKLYGIQIDTTHLNEVIACLYILYLSKENLHQSNINME